MPLRLEASDTYGEIKIKQSVKTSDVMSAVLASDCSDHWSIPARMTMMTL